MSYAIRNDGMGWRAVNGPDDVGPDETFSATIPSESLALAQVAQTEAMYVAYSQAVQQSVSFKSAGGVTQTFQADTNSQNILLQSYTGFQAAGAVPAAFYWVAADNTQVSFTLADLKGLYAAMLAQGWAAFQQLQTRKASIRAATTSAAVKAITW